MEAGEKASRIVESGSKALISEIKYITCENGTHTGGNKTPASKKETFTGKNQTYTSESLETQIEIAKKYVEEFNRRKPGESIEVVGCYTDLGKTGSNFERSGFHKLMQDNRLG